VLFRLRGRSRDSILDALRQKRQANAPQEQILDGAPPTEVPPAATESGHLDSDLSQYWNYDAPLDSDLVVITPSDSTVLDVLGKIPVPPEDAPAVMATLKEIYQSVGQQAMMRALS
jgi:uncharacterized Zn finger protein